VTDPGAVVLGGPRPTGRSRRPSSSPEDRRGAPLACLPQARHELPLPAARGARPAGRCL